MRILSLLCPGSLLLCMFDGCLLLPQPACAQPQAAADTNGATANLLTRALGLGCSEARDFLEALRHEGH